MQSCSFTFWQAAILPLWRPVTTFPIVPINTFTHRAHIFSLSSQILPQFHFSDVDWGRHRGQQANTGAVFSVSWKRARDILAGPGFQGYPVLHVRITDNQPKDILVGQKEDQDYPRANWISLAMSGRVRWILFSTFTIKGPLRIFEDLVLAETCSFILRQKELFFPVAFWKMNESCFELL